MNTRAKILNPVIDVVDAGVNLIKGKKKQTLEPVDYSLTAPVTKVDDTKTKSVPDGRLLDPEKAYTKWNIPHTHPSSWKEYRTKPITTTGKSREDLVKDKYTGYLKKSTAEEDVSIAPAHIQQKYFRPESKEIRKSIEQLKNPDARHFESGFADFPRAIDDYVSGGVNRSLGTGISRFIHPDFVTPEKYLPKVDFKVHGKKIFFGGKDSGFTTQSEGIVTNVIRNQTYHQHYENRLVRWLTEKKLIQQSYKEKKITKGRMLSDMETVNSHIKNIERDMRKLGLESAIWDEAKKSFRYFGKAYDNQFKKLLEDMPKEYLLRNPPYSISKGFDKSKKEYWMKPEGNKEGGLIRPNMALGGDMAQYEQMESVVPDLNPDEAEMQLAMSFKNPFKLKKQPPLIDDLDTNLKIADQGPGTAKTATKTHTLDAGVGSDSVFYLKSDLELANSVQDKMTPQQWLGYLTKKGVSPTELDEFGLKNLIYSMGGWDESTKKWKNNKAISKSDLIAAYKNEKPIITYKINQVEPFEKGVKDFALFISKRKSGGSYYHGDVDPMGDTRGLLNKPQDIAGDTMRQQLMKYFGNNQDFKKDWAQGEKAMTNDFNKIYKQFYGIDNVVENGVPEGMKIPFYSRNLVDRFNRLRKGEGFYFQKGKNVRHEGSQFMPGGTGYIEIPFTYNPNPKGKRANEPRFSFGEGHFKNPEGNNPVFWMRASERVDEQGNRILFIEEIQSDMHQKVKQKPDTFSYAPRQDSPGMIDSNIALKQFDNLKLELGKVTDQIDKITGHTDPSAVTVMERLKVKREAIRKQMEDIQKSIQKAAKEDSDEVFPEGPFKKSENQTKVALKTAINLAIKEGFDGVAMVTGKAKNKFANASGDTAKGNLGFYDNIAVKAMKGTAKNLELDFSATNIKDGEGNTWARIPVINLKEAIINKSVDLYKAVGGYIHRPSFVDVVPTL